MKINLTLILLISTVLLTTACSNNEALNEDQEIDMLQDVRNGERGEGRNNGASLQNSKLEDEELQAILGETLQKFELFSYTSESTGESLEYYLSIPENYDLNQKYPLLMFIPDASTVGKEASYSLSQGYGAGVWVTDEAQAENPAIVIVPIFKEVAVNDNFEVSNEPELAVELISKLSQEYSVDENRIYTTGQSMGCMTSFHLNLKYPDLFAASLFVSGQWDISLMKSLENQKFFYIVAEGDPKASKGQQELMDLFSQNGVSYSFAEWDASLSEEEQNSNVENMLSEGNNINFIRFTLGSTYPEGMSESQSASGEHMTSFDFGYKIGAVREWLFNQVK